MQPDDPDRDTIPSAPAIPTEFNQAREFASIAGNMLDAKLRPIRRALAAVTDEIQVVHKRIDRTETRLSVLESTRIIIPTIPGMVALLVALAALMRGL